MNADAQLRRLALVAVILLASIPVMAGTQPAPLTGTKGGFVITPDGIKIHYLEAGKGPAMLFIPGWTMPAEIWEKQIAHFSKTHRVVAMDPRAQGQSSKATDGLYPAARARDIKAVVDELHLAPAVLVGWSMGVSELAAYIDQFGNDSVAALVFVDGIAGMDPNSDFMPQFSALLMSMQKDRQKTTEGFVRSMYKAPQSEEYLKRITEASLATPTNSTVTLGVSLFWTDNRPALAKISKPTLIIVAAGGPMMPLCQEMHQRIAGSRMEVIENAGHALFVDQSERFNSLLEEFLRSLK